MTTPLAEGGIPDARYIREKIPIVKIASVLGLEVFPNRMVRCWHTERHHNGDRTPSVGVYARYNKLKCFGNACDGKPLGPIDLVVDVRECTPKEAIRWIAQRFPVPLIPKGKHLAKKTDQVARYGFERPTELLVRSGLWAKMSPPARALVVVFVELVVESHRAENWEFSISYQGLGRYSGLKSSASIAKGLQELEVIGWLRRSRVPPTRAGQGPLRETNKYFITPFSDAVRELANSTVSEFRDAIDEERQMRADRRARRTRAWRHAKAR